MYTEIHVCLDHLLSFCIFRNITKNWSSGWIKLITIKSNTKVESSHQNPSNEGSVLMHFFWINISNAQPIYSTWIIFITRYMTLIHQCNVNIKKETPHNVKPTNVLSLCYQYSIHHSSDSFFLLTSNCYSQLSSFFCFAGIAQCQILSFNVYQILHWLSEHLWESLWELPFLSLKMIVSNS